MFLLGVDETPSDDERNQCASAFVLSTISEYPEYPQLRGDPKMDNQWITERFSVAGKTYPVA